MTVKDLNELLRNIQPVLNEGRYYMMHVDQSSIMVVANYLNYVIDVFREDEGLSVVFSGEILEEMKSVSKSDIAGPFAFITLNVYSDLLAVGFLAKVTSALARKNISVNAYSAFHHDHLFVPFEKSEEAMAALMDLSK